MVTETKFHHSKMTSTGVFVKLYQPQTVKSDITPCLSTQITEHFVF